MKKINKLIFADVHNSGIQVSYDMTSSFEILVPYFSGQYECRLVDDSLGWESVTGDHKTITEKLSSSEYVSGGSFFVNTTEESRLTIPKLLYSDITEQVVINSDEIKAGNLSSESQGILAFSGVRKIKLSFEGNFNAAVKRIQVKFRVDTANGCTLDQIIQSDVFSLSDVKTSCVIIELDTDKLGRVFSGKFEKMESVVLGCIVQAEISTSGSCFIVDYPVKIALINTLPELCRQRSKHAASIDFGTTSTCVAIETAAGKELLTISAIGQNDENEYENPTNLMIFNWDEIYKQWVQSNTSAMPALYKGTKIDYKNWLEKKSDHKTDFDFGYHVKDELGAEVPDKKTVNSILSLIKMIPYRIVQEKRQIKLIPFNDDKKFVYVTTSPEAQDEEHFDPIAFYGYLIGRAINDRSRHQEIHTNFLVTSPVKFNPEIKEILRNSLLFGLKRSVPTPMQDSVTVEMRYDEPVAYIGAICGTEFFKVANGTEKFAVYDFGGGTLDFSFGEVSNDEDGETNINVRMVGGRENIGGESLIERMTFNIYCHNLKQMVDNDIPIEKPAVEQLPAELDRKYIIPDQYSIANTNSINYAISRRIFEGRNVNSPVDLNLYDRQGVEKKIKINFDKDALEGFLDNVIKDSIDGFVREMHSAFADDRDFRSEQVHVFLAGNSSKNSHVYANMKKALSGCDIQKPDQTDSIIAAETKASNTKSSIGGRGAKKPDTQTVSDIAETIAAEPAKAIRPVVNKRYAITPKTAVALGQLKLNNFSVSIDNKSFKLYIGIFNPGTGAFMTRLKKGESSTEWVRFKKITNGKVDVYYSESAPLDGTQNTTAYRTITGLDEFDGKVLFVRMKDQYVIEYCIGDSNETESIPADAEVFEERFD